MSSVPELWERSPDLLRERVILVTGAGGGIGRAVARAAAAHGATVLLHGRHPEGLEATYDAIVAAQGSEPALLPLDLATAQDSDFRQLAAVIERALGRLDGIVHTAGVPPELGTLDQGRLEEWLLHWRVTVAAAAAVNRACAPLLAAAPDASVVLTLESHGLDPAAFWGPTAAAGAGLAALLQVQAQEWSGRPGLRINGVVPGRVDSPHRGRTHPGETRAERAPADSLMPAYLYLLSGSSRGINGQVLRPGQP